jgi:hypothetical protein
LITSSLCINAQQEQPSIDSIKEIIETAIEDEDSSGTAAEAKKYFLKRWSFNEQTDSLQLRKLPDSLVKTMQADDDFWYANASIKKDKPKKEDDRSYTPLGQRSWFQTLMWVIIIGGFAGFIIWFLAGNNAGLFRRRQKLINSNEDEETITQDIFAINYQKEIDKASQQGNYRLAVRLMFLRLLKELSEKNIIQYKQGLTNAEYLAQLNRTTYYPTFFRLTRNYEYSWYGLFDVSAEAYSVISKDFINFSNQLR